MSMPPESVTLDVPRSGTEPGVWDGQYIDVNGHRARLRLTLTLSNEGAIGGRYELVFPDTDRAKVVSGEIEGRQSADTISFHAPLRTPEQKSGGTEQRLHYEAHISDRVFAGRQALFGVVTASRQPGFGGGVWIAWRSKDRAAVSKR